MLKMIHDTEIFRVMPTIDLFGFEFGLRNPFVFPCQPRLAVRKRLETKRKKIEQERKEGKKEKVNDQNVPNDLHTVRWDKQEMILPRDDVDALIPDEHMGKLLYDLSVVTEEHWIIICHLESALRAEEEMYTRKKSGPAQAGTGWGLERWAKTPWKCKHKVHSHSHHNNHHHKRNNINNNMDNDNETNDDDDDDDHYGHRSLAQQRGEGDENWHGNDRNRSPGGDTRQQHITHRKKNLNNTRRYQNNVDEPPKKEKKKISKEQHTQMMAKELQMEESGKTALRPILVLSIVSPVIAIAVANPNCSPRECGPQHWHPKDIRLCIGNDRLESWQETQAETQPYL